MRTATVSILGICALVGLTVAASPPVLAQALGPAPPVLLPPPAGPPLAPVYVVDERRYHSPGLAAVLSLQPLPIDLGNLYAENLGWGIAYTAVEVSLLSPMMWMTGGHMSHDVSGGRTWSSGETGAMIGLGAGYVAVKLLSAVHAGYSARAFNGSLETRGMAIVTPTRGGAALGWAASY